MDKKGNCTCSDCIHEWACQAWNSGVIHNMDATMCAPRETLKDSNAYFLGRREAEKEMDKLMLEAAAEIKELRSQLEFQRKLADDNNNSRLRLLDVIGNCRDLYEETCKKIREEHVDNSVCGMCIEDCDHGFDGYENECRGFEEDDCFRLNINKFNDIVFKKKGAQE